MSGMYPDDQALQIYGKEVSFPGLKDGKFTNGDFNDPLVPPSFIPAETVNLMLDNLTELITSLGGIANNAATSQLADLFSSAALGGKGIKRAANGTAKVAAPDADEDIANRRYVDDKFASGFPVGMQYAQYHGGSAPDVLFGGTWTKIHTGGYFFRTEGGNAGAFNGVAQGHGLASHGHTASSGSNNGDHVHEFSSNGMSANNPHRHSVGTENPLYSLNGLAGGPLRIQYRESVASGEVWYVDHTNIDHIHSGGTGGVSANHSHAITVNANGITETRPDNKTFVLWQKTA